MNSHEDIDCPNCLTALTSSYHARMADDWELYCDQCANRIRVSFYDPVVSLLRNQHSDFKAVIREIEARLRHCECGGMYGFSSPRRCPECLTIIISGKSGVDLWPRDYYVDPDELPLEREKQIHEFVETHFREDDIWKVAP